MANTFHVRGHGTNLYTTFMRTSEKKFDCSYCFDAGCERCRPDQSDVNCRLNRIKALLIIAATKGGKPEKRHSQLQIALQEFTPQIKSLASNYDFSDAKGNTPWHILCQDPSAPIPLINLMLTEPFFYNSFSNYNGDKQRPLDRASPAVKQAIKEAITYNQNARKIIYPLLAEIDEINAISIRGQKTPNQPDASPINTPQPAGA